MVAPAERVAHLAAVRLAVAAGPAVALVQEVAVGRAAAVGRAVDVGPRAGAVVVGPPLVAVEGVAAPLLLLRGVVVLAELALALEARPRDELGFRLLGAGHVLVGRVGAADVLERPAPHLVAAERVPARDVPLEAARRLAAAEHGGEAGVEPGRRRVDVVHVDLVELVPVDGQVPRGRVRRPGHGRDDVEAPHEHGPVHFLYRRARVRHVSFQLVEGRDDRRLLRLLVAVARHEAEGAPLDEVAVDDAVRPDPAHEVRVPAPRLGVGQGRVRGADAAVGGDEDVDGDALLLQRLDDVLDDVLRAGLLHVVARRQADDVALQVARQAHVEAPEGLAAQQQRDAPLVVLRVRRGGRRVVADGRRVLLDDGRRERDRERGDDIAGSRHNSTRLEHSTIVGFILQFVQTQFVQTLPDLVTSLEPSGRRARTLVERLRRRRGARSTRR